MAQVRAALLNGTCCHAVGDLTSGVCQVALPRGDSRTALSGFRVQTLDLTQRVLVALYQRLACTNAQSPGAAGGR